ncbi:hypothetical protein BB558_001924 [Smittium angustum]|uniref:Bystin n=1 Tax=Smittium angustum TaxID=133377 RepID=A0A2U1JA23_SMIAN|nr:hypothetical protein BB558_001924 [Smittium angustum]
MPKVHRKNKEKHESLDVVYSEERNLAKKGVQRTKYHDRESKRAKKELDQSFVDPKLSNKILKVAREQQEELESEMKQLKKKVESGTDQYAEFPDDEYSFGNEARTKESGFESDDFGDMNDSDEDYDTYEYEVDAKDAALFEKLMPRAPQQRQNLADIIAAKIGEFNKAHMSSSGTTKDENMDKSAMSNINPKVAQVYKKVGELLSRYKSGPLPKAFKIIPSIKNWEEVLYLTEPNSWTPHAAQRFLNLVLLDRVREDISENKKLNYHLYMALKKALYKPAAFFKGVLFPLCETGNCTLREAVIISSVLSKVSVPVLHSAAALMHLANLEYNGPTALLIRVLLDKKYALPYKVIDALVFHFTGFLNQKEDEMIELPVLWHQSFLVFAQRYKSDLAPDQKRALLDVLKVHYHPDISEEIKRELINSVCRGEIVFENDIEMK